MLNELCGFTHCHIFVKFLSETHRVFFDRVCPWLQFYATWVLGSHTPREPRCNGSLRRRRTALCGGGNAHGGAGVRRARVVVVWRTGRFRAPFGRGARRGAAAYRPTMPGTCGPSGACGVADSHAAEKPRGCPASARCRHRLPLRGGTGALLAATGQGSTGSSAGSCGLRAVRHVRGAP